MTKIQAYLSGMQTQQGVRFRDMLLDKKNIGLNVSFLHISYQRTMQLWFRRCDAFHETPSIGRLYWKRYSCCGKEKLCKKRKKTM